jgi:hypothetical protein
VEFVRQSFMLPIKVLKLNITQNSPDVVNFLTTRLVGDTLLLPSRFRDMFILS